MPLRFQLSEHRALASMLVRWGLLGAGVGVLAGCSSAFFLILLAWATQYREAHPALLWGLPVAGIGIVLLSERFGKSAAGGSNLILERIHNPEGQVPFRMAPLILFTTVITHLFGGSAGREGTAMQMAGSLADACSRPLRLSPADRRLLLMSAISGGFGAVFGTPLAGTVFGLEVLSVGRLRYDALVPCFVASFIGDVVCRAWGVRHHLYPLGQVPTLSPGLVLLVVIAGLLFGAASFLFAECTDAVHRLLAARVARPWFRPVLGGSVVVALTYALGTQDYLGLGIPLIERSFTPEGVFLGAFALKLLFTAVTLGSGFKGGEVTPLFCIGATLGAAFARLTGQPTGFFAALGFVAVFAGAANTPLACVLMGLELFGSTLGVPLAVACILSYVVSGHRGIYLAQQVDTAKAPGLTFPAGSTLREVRAGWPWNEPGE